jgi:erythromycin esterase-like protein
MRLRSHTDDEVRTLLEKASWTSRASAANIADVPPKRDAVGIVRDGAEPLHGDPSQYDALLEGIGGAHLVLLGEATHGTHEFYRERAFITRRLIVEKGFSAVAVEADWPDAYRINRYVRGVGGDEDAVQALAGFGRFPTWMWRNADVLDFIGWLRTHNDHLPAHQRAGFYGLDLYSLRQSMEAVLAYLDKIDPDAARRARHRYGCFDQFGDPQEYGYAAGYGLHPSCERGGGSASRSSSAASRIREPRWPRGCRRLLLRGAERAPRAQRRGILPDDVQGPGRFVESS